MPHKTSSKSNIIQPKSFTVIQRIISIFFLIGFTIIFTTVICFNWIPYCGRKELLLPNIISLLISLITGTCCYYLFRKLPLSKKSFHIVIGIIFIVLFIIQLFILYHIQFKPGWDAGAVNVLADQVVAEGSYTTVGSGSYLAMYPNNALIVTILSFLKSLPVIGEKYFTIVAFNALLVNLAGFITCLTIEKLISRRAALMTTFVVAPLLLLSPWTIIPYSDTFTILIPILVFYTYISTKKWWKYFPIVFLSLIGYYLKPTAIFVLVAIVFVELFRRRWHRPTLNKDFWLRTLAITNSILLALLAKYASFSHINYQPNQTIKSASVAHYLSMGQNEENCGRYLEEDYLDMQKGKDYELKKFCDRITSRTPSEQVDFFAKKLLTNFDDGTFAWGVEGNFYYEIPERNNPISDFLTSIYYHNTGDNYKYFAQLVQAVWVFVLFGCIFAFKKNPSSSESVLKAALIGICLFVMLFEARARYLFCYAPMFIVCSIVGYSHLRKLLLYKNNNQDTIKR